MIYITQVEAKKSTTRNYSFQSPPDLYLLEQYTRRPPVAMSEAQF